MVLGLFSRFSKGKASLGLPLLNLKAPGNLPSNMAALAGTKNLQGVPRPPRKRFVCLTPRLLCSQFIFEISHVFHDSEALTARDESKSYYPTGALLGT